MQVNYQQTLAVSASDRLRFERLNPFPTVLTCLSIENKELYMKLLHSPTILGEFGGADQGGDSEGVSGADRQASTAGHAAGTAAQCCPLVGVTVRVAG